MGFLNFTQALPSAKTLSWSPSTLVASKIPSSLAGEKADHFPAPDCWVIPSIHSEVRAETHVPLSLPRSPGNAVLYGFAHSAPRHTCCSGGMSHPHRRCMLDLPTAGSVLGAWLSRTPDVIRPRTPLEGVSGQIAL